MNAVSQSYSGIEGGTRSKSQGNLDAVDVWFSRYRRVLSLVACRVLDKREEAEDAVQNCFLATSCNVPQIENEGAFRSWLVRVLIDEALAIRYKDKSASSTSSESILLDSLNFHQLKNGEQCNSTSGNWRC
jgi:DNA-directed RNA polymerase specialized sigma24 family protein